MRYRLAQSRVYLLLLTLPLVVLHSPRLFAELELADEHSLSNGAQLYGVFCSDCHGTDVSIRYDQLYTVDEPRAIDQEYEKLIEMVKQEESAQLIAVPEEEEAWPEWAEMPDPNAEAEPDEKTEVMNTLSAVIDEVHGIKPTETPATNAGEASNPAAEWTEGQPGDVGPPGGFEPMPGATNLADPASYFYGTSQEELFDSIANGKGRSMPGFRTELGSDEAIQDVVNYIRSFWSEEWLY